MLCSLVSLVSRHYTAAYFQCNIGGTKKTRSARVGPIVTSRKWSYCEGKKETIICGKFKITERQNESYQNLQSWKVPKLWQIFGKIGLGVRVPKLWRIPRARQIQEIHIKYTWKTYRGTLDQGGIEPSTDLDRPYCNYLVGHWLGRKEFSPKTDLFLDN